MYYPKFHFKLNYIEYFWCNGKNWIRRNCKYNISKALAQVKISIILKHDKSCLKKIDLYRKKIQGDRKKLTFHLKTWAVNDDR